MSKQGQGFVDNKKKLKVHGTAGRVKNVESVYCGVFSHFFKFIFLDLRKAMPWSGFLPRTDESDRSGLAPN